MIDLRVLSKGLATSRTVSGGLSLLLLLVGNVRIQCDLWIFDTHYHFQDGNILAALVGFALLVWGRLQAPGPLIVPKPQSAPQSDEPLGFPRPGQGGGA